MGLNTPFSLKQLPILQRPNDLLLMMIRRKQYLVPIIRRGMDLEKIFVNSSQTGNENKDLFFRHIQLIFEKLLEQINYSLSTVTFVW